MKAFTCLMFLFCCFLSCYTHAAEKVIWTGEVNADGTPTQAANLTLGEKYIIKVSGFVNLGKWWQNRQALADDASYEFNAPDGPTKLQTFQNSLNIPTDGEFHTDHIYRSAPFIAEENKVHFWIKDSDYSDNTGALKVEIIRVGPPPKS